MKYLTTVAAFFFMLGAIGYSTPVHAQVDESIYPALERWSVNVNSGFLLAQNDLSTGLIDESEDADAQGVEMTYLVDGDVSYRFASRIIIGGQFSWSPLGQDAPAPGPDTDAVPSYNLYLYSGQVGYLVPYGRLAVYGRAGFGGATRSVTADGEPEIDNSETNPYAPVTLGLKFAMRRHFNVNIMVRDNIIFSGGELEATSNNVFFGGGVSYVF